MVKNSLLVASFFISLISSASCGKEKKIPPGDYLIWPEIDFDRNDFHAKVRSALKRLVAEERIYEQDPEGALETMAAASRNKAFSLEERDIFSKIYRLRDNNNCGYQQLILIQSLWFQMKNGMLPAILERAIEHACRFSIWHCSQERPQTMWQIDGKLLSQLDTTFAAVFGVEKLDSARLGTRLAGLLQGFDLASDTFNAKQMVAVMRELVPDETSKPFDLLSDFLLSRCARFHKSLKVTIAFMDLIRWFGTRAAWESAQLVRMDEYNRLCLALSSAKKQVAIRNNLELQLARRAPKEVLSGMLQKLRN